MPQAFDLNFRTAPSGGDIDTDRPKRQAQALRGFPHLIFLIHGYNNDQHDGEVAYQAFCDREQALVGPGRDWAPGGVVVRVFWPGDARWWIASPLYYPFAVPRALTIAQALAGIMKDLAQHAPDVLTVDAVAHSLGNRVLFHCLLSLLGSANLFIRRVVHMAAAVPTWTLSSTARTELLRGALINECAPPARAASLFSGHDMVLALAFPPGETAAPTYDGEFPVALGHSHWGDGDPIVDLTQLEAVGAGHSSYWGANKNTSPALKKWIADTVNAQLDLGNGATRSTPSALQPERQTADARPTNARSIGERVVGSSEN
jgi:hypothetical protein